MMLKARWNAREKRTRHRDPAVVPDPGGRQRQGWRRQELGHRQPRSGRRRAGFHRRRSSMPTSGASPCRACSASSDRLEAQPVEGSDKPKIIPQRAPVGRGAAQGRQHRVPRRGGHGADVAWSDAHQGGRAVPPRRALGRARLPVHRHAAGHRRRADGARPDAAAHRPADRHDAGARRAEGGRSRGRHGAAQLPARRRRDREHERVHVRPRHVVRAVRRGRRSGARRRDRRAAARPDPARAGGRRRRRRRGRRSSIDGDGRGGRRVPPHRP